MRVSSNGEADPASDGDEWTIVADQGGGSTVETAGTGGASTTGASQTGPAQGTIPGNQARVDGDAKKGDERDEPPADPTPPAVTILGGPPGTTRKTVAVFRFSPNEPVSRVECSLGGGDDDRQEPPPNCDQPAILDPC